MTWRRDFHAQQASAGSSKGLSEADGDAFASGGIGRDSVVGDDSGVAPGSGVRAALWVVGDVEPALRADRAVHTARS